MYFEEKLHDCIKNLIQYKPAQEFQFCNTVLSRNFDYYGMIKS